MPSSPEPPPRIPRGIDAPMVQQITCTCLRVLQVVNGLARCCHGDVEIAYRVEITERVYRIKGDA